MAYFEFLMRGTYEDGVASRVVVLVALAVSTACASRSPEVGLPPIPAKAGPLAIDVVYPPDSVFVTARDSNFIFGSVGSGSAGLTINGHDVTVEPNGAFLAWLPLPGAAGDSLADYHLAASLAGQTVSATHTIRRRPTPMKLASSSATIDTASVAPRGSWWVRHGEAITIGVRASPGAAVRLLLPSGDTLPLRAEPFELSGEPAVWVFGRIPTAIRWPTSPVYHGELIAREPLGRGYVTPSLSPLAVRTLSAETYCARAVDSLEAIPRGGSDVVDDSAAAARDEALHEQSLPADSSEAVVPVEISLLSDGCAVVEVATRDDTTRLPLPLDVWIQSDRPVIELQEQPSAVGSDGFVIGRAARGATTFWQWTPGMMARVTGRRDGALRLGLDDNTEAWVPLEETVWLYGRTLPERARVGTVRFEGRDNRIRARIALPFPVPYQVQLDGNRLNLTLYGAYSNTDWLLYGEGEPYLRSAAWEQATTDRYILRLELAAPAWGYRVSYGGGGLILEVRKPPVIDGKRPLSGRTIAVDPGHPPAGATGPTRLYEGDANLAVALRLKRMLEEDGATVIMTRADSNPVRLYDRTQLAEALDAEILVSIHNNALPDGVNPFENHGTSVFYFHPGSLDLALALQSNLLRTLGLRDLGIGRASLALARPTWMPAALTEGAFMMIPEQEAALREPAFQAAYARGILEGLREFLRARAE